MNLRVPAGSLLESFLTGLGSQPQDAAGGTTIPAATETQVTEAVAAMERGDIEYVILEDGDEFLQAAGSADGPYALQFSPAAAAQMIEVRGGVDARRMRDVLLAYTRRDPRWRGALPWS